MLDYNILAQKPKISFYKDNKKVSCYDLTTKTYNDLDYSKDDKVLMVTEDYTARPDLISLAVYGDDKYGDIICKVNGISNPFELNQGMIIVIPAPSILNKLLTGSSSENDILEEFKSPSPSRKDNISGTTSNKSKKLNNVLNKNKETIEKKKKNLQKLKTERRSPGDQTVEDSNYYIDKSLGLVVY